METRVASPNDAEGMSQVLRDIIAQTGRERPSDTAFVTSHYIANPSTIRCTVAIDETGSVIGFQSLKKAEADKAALAKAAESGTLTKEQERGMSKEQLEAVKKRQKENEAAMKHNKELNDSFNGGMQAMEAKQISENNSMPLGGRLKRGRLCL